MRRWTGLAALAAIVAGLCGCAVGWQINMPYAYSASHSRGSGYNSASGKELGTGGTPTEAFQQIRAEGDLPISVEADKATDLAAASEQGQVANETSKGAREGQGATSGDVKPTNAPKDSKTKTVQASFAPGGVAGGKAAGASESPDATQNADEPKAEAAPSPTIAELQAEVANRQRVAELVGSGGGADGADTPAQAQAKAELSAAKERLAAATK